MIKESQPIEKRPTQELSASDYREIGRQLLEIDKKMARAYFRQGGLNEEEIRQLESEFDVARQKKEEKNEKGLLVPDGEKKKLYEKIATEFEENFRKTGKAEYLELAKTYRREAEKLTE